MRKVGPASGRAAVIDVIESRTVYLLDEEIGYLDQLSKGKIAKEIASSYGITTSALENRLGLIRQRLHAFNTTHAVAIALRSGLIR